MAKPSPLPPGASPISRTGATRRSLLARLAAGAGALAGLALDRSAPAAAAPPDPAPASPGGLTIPFYGPRQAGIVTPQPYAGLVAAFDVLAETRDELEAMFRTLTERAAFLTQGGAPQDHDPSFPPADSGILGPQIAPERMTVTLAVGASLFDDRFGLAGQRPRQLVAMPDFVNDSLESEMCHGDLVVQLCADTPEETLHALRDIVKHTPDSLALRWKLDGFTATHGNRSSGLVGTGRNMLGFKDGTSNPDVTDEAHMDRLVWIQPGGGERDWAVGGSYLVVRLVRNYVERWDRTPLGEQEAIIGRHRDSGAPLGKTGEFDDPDYDSDPQAERIAADAHIRLANPHGTRQAAPMLRRGLNYSRGVTASGQMDMGLLFIAYQADLASGFTAVQNRLNGEPLEEYIKPFGGGYYFALPGVLGPHDYFGRSLLEARSASSASAN